jgi:hypothetical protein
MSLKHLWKTIQETEPIIWIAYALGILFVGGMVFMAQGCGLFRSASETADTLNRTVQSVDRDGSGAISMQEIIQYCVGGWIAGRATETVGKIGVKRIRNGRKSNDTACRESGDS